MTKQTIVVKLGGEVIASSELSQLTADLAELGRSARLVVTHGGGPQATKLQEALGQTPIKIAGRRVTDAATLDVMKMVLAGKLNVDLCAALVKVGAKPVGLHGASDMLIAAERRPPRVYSGAGPEPVDLGYVGDVVSVDTELLEVLLGAGRMPVLACLGCGSDGQVYNINADIVATKVAVALAAASLVLISDVRGVLRDVKDPSSRIARMTIGEGQALIQSGVVKEGMIPKLEECFSAISAGAKQVHIVGRLSKGELSSEIANPGSIGTVVVA